MKNRTAVFDGSFRAEEEDGNKRLSGYFIRYGQETELFPGCVEEVRQGAATESLKDNDIRCLFNHDSGSVLGRTSNGTLKLTEDENGVFGEVQINENDPEAMSVYAKVQRGDIDGCSFGFQIQEETHEIRDDGSSKFYLDKVNVFEVSAVTFPAYPQTDISARTNDINNLKQRSLNTKKLNLKERLTNGIKTIND